MKLVLCVVVAALATTSVKGAEPLSEAVKHTENVWKFPEYIASCMKIDALVKGATSELEVVESFEKSLKWVAPALGLTQAALMTYQGKNLDAMQKIGSVGADALVCTNTLICPAWTVGRTVGDVINGLVSLSRKDEKNLTDLLEDLYVSVAIDAPMTARELVRLELAVAMAKARRQAVVKATRTCSDARQTRSGVDELLGKAKPSAPIQRSTPTQAPSTTECLVLKDTAASERLSSRDPDAYDALLARCF